MIYIYMYHYIYILKHIYFKRYLLLNLYREGKNMYIYLTIYIHIFYISLYIYIHIFFPSLYKFKRRFLLKYCVAIMTLGST